MTGLALTFDDNHISNWHNLRPILNHFQAKATFFVSHWDRLTPAEIDKLHQLQNDGHEIGVHGLNHISIKDYAGPLWDYNDREVIVQLEMMNQAGFYPTSLAYVKGHRFPSFDNLLLNYFKFVRGTAYAHRYLKLWHLDDVFFNPIQSTRLVFGASIDHHRHLKLSDIESALERARTNSEILILYGHCPVWNNSVKPYEINVYFLEDMLRMTSVMGLSFYTISSFDYLPLNELTYGKAKTHTPRLAKLLGWTQRKALEHYARLSF